MKQYDLVVIGSGISGMTAALAALERGIEKVLLLEREEILGGIISQCIHNGFGEKILDTKLTGPEYIDFFECELNKYNVDIKVNANVLNITNDKIVTYVSPDDGVINVQGKAIVVATGCREKYTGNIDIPTNKFTGIYTVGNTHRTITIEGYMPGKRPVIVANSKWGVYVAKRFVIEGAKVQALIVEENEDFIMDENFLEIIDGFNIPVVKNSRIIGALGKERIESIKIFNYDTKEISDIFCDALILSVGYFPENEIMKNLNIDINNDTKAPVVKDYETSVPGIFACGNLIYGIHALKQTGVDGFGAGKSVVKYINSLKS